MVCVERQPSFADGFARVFLPRQTSRSGTPMHAKRRICCIAESMAHAANSHCIEPGFSERLTGCHMHLAISILSSASAATSIALILGSRALRTHYTQLQRPHIARQDGGHSGAE